MDDVRGDFLGPPHGTTPTAVIANENKTDILVFASSDAIKPYLMNGFSHHYHLGESTFIFRGIRSDFLNFNQFFYENSLSKQNSPRWDAAFCGVASGAILFAYVP